MKVFDGMPISFKIPGHTCKGTIEKIWDRDIFDRKEKWLVIKGVRDDGVKGAGLLIQEESLKHYILEDEIKESANIAAFEQLSLY